MLLRNARVAGDVVDVALADGRIAAIGQHLTETESLDGLEPIDLDGRWLMPGLWDEHVHFSMWAAHRQRIDVSSAGSAAEAARLVARANPGSADASQPLVGVGFRDALWPDIPTAAVLDEAVRHRPVVLLSNDLHSCWLNTLAVERFGASAAFLREEECFEVGRRLDDVPQHVLDEWVAEAGAAAASRGVVGIVDLEMSWGFDAWERRLANGFDTLRIEAGVYPQFLDRAVAAGLRSGRALGELLSVGPFKVITDGSLGTRTAFCFDPYPGLAEHPHGLLTVPPEELVPLLERARDAGLTPAVHAIGDHANRLALDAFDAVGCTGRIEHAQLLDADDVPRFAALGVTASVQPEHAMDDRDIAERYWPGRTQRAFVLRSLIDAGARIVLGSDAPVAPLDPWVSIAAAVGRSRDGLPPWHPEQSVTAEEAIGASVRTRVAVGEPADLVVLDRDPLQATADELRVLPVHATYLAGRRTWSA